MCKVINTVGSLNYIEAVLKENDISEFHSTQEILYFLDNSNFIENEIILKHTLLIQKEKEALEQEIQYFENILSTADILYKKELEERKSNLYTKIEELPVPTSNILSILKDYCYNMVYMLQIWVLPLQLKLQDLISFYREKLRLAKINKRHSSICDDFEEAVQESAQIDLQAFNEKCVILRGLRNFIYGAFGENKVVEKLSILSDDFVLINDFKYTFEKPIKNYFDSDFIKSIQLDHVLISPSGIFIIETKFWSEYSLDKIKLFSPVMQIKRANYALSQILRKEVEKSNRFFARSHWGTRKIPIRNIIVFVGKKPMEEFEYVKIVGLNQLIDYIKYFKPSFNADETSFIADFLMKTSDKKNVNSKLTF